MLKTLLMLEATGIMYKLHTKHMHAYERFCCAVCAHLCHVLLHPRLHCAQAGFESLHSLPLARYLCLDCCCCHPGSNHVA
jgi:hypothetical protein